MIITPASCDERFVCLCVQLDERCKELEAELSAYKQQLASVEGSHAELKRNFVALYRVAAKALAQRDDEICRLNSR